jgi:hypothetical protein
VHPSLPLGSGITLLYANPPAASTKDDTKDDEGQSNRVPADVLTQVSLVCDLDAGAAPLDAGSSPLGAAFDQWADSFGAESGGTVAGGNTIGMGMLSGISLADAHGDELIAAAGAGALGSGEGVGVGQPVRLGKIDREQLLRSIAGIDGIIDAPGQQQLLQHVEWRSMIACPICQKNFFMPIRTECKGGWQRVQHIR